MADATLPDNLTAGTPIAGIDVTMSDGSQFIGDLAAEPATIVTIAAGNLVLARNLTPADVGPDTWEVTATQDGYTATGELDVEIIATPIAVTFTPGSADLPDNAPAGAYIATVSVTMSDGSPYAGGLLAAPPTIVEMDGDDLVTARPLTSADVGPQQFSVTTVP
jgi:hypothetical protein